MSWLEKINSPADIKTLSVPELTELATELRELIAETVAKNGGHLASNLGVVELTLALHYCFDVPNDRLLWDVGHQCYVHKILTGRREKFSTIRVEDGLSGFPDVHESEYDQFSVGHAGTAIATAVGLAHGDQLAGRDSHVISVVGDASIVNGLSFEGLNNAGVLRRQLLVILNDNEMAIDVTQGAMAKHLNRLRFTHAYEDLRRKVHNLLEYTSLGRSVLESLDHIKQGVKTALTHGQIFEQMGITYLGPIDGHDLKELIRALTVVRDAPYPILLHVKTQKGKGYKFAASDPCAFHSPSGYELNGDATIISPTSKKSFTSVFGNAIVELGERDDKIVALTAAMPDGTGLVDFRTRFPDRYFDVGICESAAVAIAAGLSKAGYKPVVAVYSTFLQRGIDQVWQEVVLQNLPVVFALDRAGLVGSDGAVHHGFCDLAFLQVLPNMVCCAPADECEMKSALEFAVNSGRAVAIRYPRDVIPKNAVESSPFELGRSHVIRRGNDATIFALGSMVSTAVDAQRTLQHAGFDVGVVSARFVKPLDAELIGELLQSGKPLIIAEDHSAIGGLGTAVMQLAVSHGWPTNRIVHLAMPADELVPHASRPSQLSMCGLDARSLVAATARAIDPSWNESRATSASTQATSSSSSSTMRVAQ